MRETIWTRVMAPLEVKSIAPAVEHSAPLPRAASPEHERILSIYKQMLLSIFIATFTIAIVVTVLMFAFLLRHEDNPFFMLVVVLAGSLGAFFSMLMRLYNFQDLPQAMLSTDLRGLPP